jgi:large subunit ribosomal protein L27
MAHTKAGGSTNNNRDSVAKRLGVKLYGGEKTKVGAIIIRQKGSKFHAGKNVRLGKDYTIYAMTEGKVLFKTAKGKTVVDVV